MKSKKSNLFLKCALIIGVTSCFSTAADFKWVGGGADANWDTLENWETNDGGWGPAIALPSNADNVANVVVGEMIEINSGTAAVADKFENSGLTGGTMVVDSGGSLTVDTTFEINRRNNGGLLTVDGGTVTIGGTAYLSHYMDTGEPETPATGTLEVMAGSFTAGYFRSDGGIGYMDITGGDVVTNANNNTFANGNPNHATPANRARNENHFSMSAGSFTSSGRDYWGGFNSTFDLSGGTYTCNGNQFHFAAQAGFYDDVNETVEPATMDVTISGGTMTLNSQFYCNKTDTILTVVQTGGDFSVVVPGGDPEANNQRMNWADQAGSSMSWSISGGSFTTGRLGMNNVNPDSNTFTVVGSTPVINVKEHLYSGSPYATLEYVFDSAGVAPINVGPVGRPNISGGLLKVDLTNYDVSNGTDVQIIASTIDPSGELIPTIIGGTAEVFYDKTDPPNAGVWLKNITVDAGGDSMIKVISVVTTGNDCVITWESVDTTTYEVLSTTDLSLPLASWTNEGDVIAAGASASYTDTDTLLGDAKKFYVVREK